MFLFPTLLLAAPTPPDRRNTAPASRPSCARLARRQHHPSGLSAMGLFNAPGTAIAPYPFGRQAGSASTLLGFLQTGYAIGATGTSTLAFKPSISCCRSDHNHGAYSASFSSSCVASAANAPGLLSRRPK